MRANIEIDDGLVVEAMALFGLTTPEATVEEALRRVLRDDAKRRAIGELIGIGWEGDLDAMREGRTFDDTK